MNKIRHSNLRAAKEYLEARFPLSNFIPLSMLLATCAVVVHGHYSHTYPGLFSYALAFFALLLFLLRLRLFDEIKDYEHDSQYYPHRPVQKNIVTIGGIRRMILIILIGECSIAVMSGNTDTYVLFLFSIMYSFLMFKEFFVRDWLRRRFSLYIFLHELLVIPLFAYIASFGGSVLQAIGREYFIFLLLFLGSSIFLLEIGRKIRDRGEEEEAMDTYSSQYGIMGASFLIFVILLTVTFSFFYLADISWFWLLAAVTAILPFIIGYSFQIRGLGAKTLFILSIAWVFGINIALITILLI